VHTRPNERTMRGCKNEQHRKLSYNLVVFAKPYFCTKWSQYTSTNTPVAYNVMGVRSSGEETSTKMNSAKLPLPLLRFIAYGVARHHPHRTHDLRSGSQDHHPSKNSVQKTICCSLTSNAPDDGHTYPKHVELRIHQ